MDKGKTRLGLASLNESCWFHKGKKGLEYWRSWLIVVFIRVGKEFQGKREKVKDNYMKRGDCQLIYTKFLKIGSQFSPFKFPS